MNFANELTLLRSICGDALKPWQDKLDHDGKAMIARPVEEALSALRVIRMAFDQGLLTTFEDLVLAKSFNSLLEQGEHLCGQGLYLPACVVFRAVLEEKLRRMCDTHGCLPVKARGHLMLNDYNQALYGASPQVYGTAMMKQVEALGAAGNDAAHNKRPIIQDDANRLLAGLTAFLSRFGA